MVNDELDKYLAHLPSRHTRKGGLSSHIKKSTQQDRSLPGLKGPRGLTTKATIDQSQQTSNHTITNWTERGDSNKYTGSTDNHVDSLVGLTKKMGLGCSKGMTTQDMHTGDTFTSQGRSMDGGKNEEYVNTQGRPSITGSRQNTDEKTNTEDIKSNRSAIQQTEAMPPIPTFSFGINDSCNNDNNNEEDEQDIFNLAVGLRCGGCDKMISGMAITAAGHRWHADCFKCQHCHQDLEHVAFYEKDGLPYCALDYHELFTTRCHYCHTPIEEKSIHALGKYYHVGHFFCRECGKPFDEDSTFMEHDGHPYCEKDYLAKFAHKCKGCKEDITGDFLEALDGKWHLACFVCVDCGKAFASNTFYIRNNLPYCEQHSRRIKKPV